MALDKLVDSSQLDADLTSVANAIRTKGGTSAQLAFPAGFVSAVEAIETGGENFPEELLMVNGIFTSRYPHTIRCTGETTIQNTFAEPIILSGGASRVQIAYVIVGPIDLTDIALVQATITQAKSNTSYVSLFIGSSDTDTAYSVPATQKKRISITANLTDYVLNLDVSDFSGEYYIGVGTDSGGSSWGGSRTCRIHNMAISKDGTPFLGDASESEVANSIAAKAEAYDILMGVSE